MAKIKTSLVDGQSVTITRAGETARVHHSHDGVLTVRNDEADSVLRLIPGSVRLDDTDDEPVADDTTPPDLPAPPPLRKR